MRKEIRRAFVAGLALGVAVLAVAREPGAGSRPKGGGMETLTKMSLASAAFSEGAAIPRKYTCDADNVSPPLKLENVPEKTQSLAMIVEDPDAPAGTWTHWVIFNIPPSTRVLPEHVPAKGELDSGARQGLNSSKKIGYDGPCPPSGTHRYFFKLYALDTRLELRAGITKTELAKAMKGHVLAETQLMGTYRR